MKTRTRSPQLLRHHHASAGEGGDAFAATDETHGLVGGGLDADACGGDAEGLADVLLHRFGMGEDAGGLGNHGRVDVAEAAAHFAHEGGGFFEDFEGGDVFAGGVAGGEVVADVWETDCT